MTSKILIAGRYQFEDHHANLIGQGGMGSVYVGKDTQSGEVVAIKVLRADRLAGDRDTITRFIREGETLRQLNHPNIVKLLAAQELNGINYLVMEYVTGGSLRGLVEKGPVPLQQIIQIGIDLADALTRAHRLNILHRDIKPDNVLLAADGTPRLTDFGMARLESVPHITQDGAILGTLAYLPPEAFNEGKVDERADIWAFGVVLYELLTGQRPFLNEQPGALINAIMNHPVLNLEDMRPDAPSALLDLVYRMLTKDVHLRVPSVRVVGAELEAILRGNPIAALFPTSSNQVALNAPTTSSSQRRQRGVPNNLPTPPTAFVGRKGELADLSKLLDDPTKRLITLVGVGGSGKSRLALQAAHNHMGAFNDGVYFVQLAALTDASHIITSIADAVNFTFGGHNPQAELFAYLAEKHMLLILDTFETVMEAANTLSDLLQAAPNLRLLITSRERLRLRSEVAYEVGGMAVPPPNLSDPEQLLGYDAVELFMQSARRVQADIALNDFCAASVASAIHALDGIPLAIELAASWLESLSLEEINDEIARSLDFLETDMRDLPERHRSMRAVFEYSWRLMSEDEQRTFSCLTVFSEGFERDAAEKIAGASLRLLTHLSNKSLLHRNAAGRYSIPKLLRQYTLERADKTHIANTEAQLARYYAQFGQQLEALYNTPRENEALDILEREHENIRFGITWAIKNADWALAEAYVKTVYSYALGRSQYQEGIDAFTQMAQQLAAQGQSDSALYWRANIGASLLSGRMGDYEGSFTKAQAGYRYFSQTQDINELAQALNVMSYARMMQGAWDEACDLAAEAITLLGDMSDVTLWYTAMANYGYAEYLRGNFETARITYESILHTSERVPYSSLGLAYMKNNLGEILRDMGDAESAEKLYNEALKIFRQLKNRRGMAFSSNNLAGILFARGHYSEAHAMYEEACRLNHEIGDLPGMANSLSALGNIALWRGDHAEAKNYYEQSLQIRRNIGDKRGIADNLMDLAELALNGEEDQRAMRLMEEVMHIRRELNDRQGLAMSLVNRAFGYIHMGELEKAKADLDEGTAIANQINFPIALAMGNGMYGKYYILMGDYAAALHHILQVLRSPIIQEFKIFGLMTLAVYSDILLARGDYRTALEIAIVTLSHPRLMHYVEMQAKKVLATASSKLSQAEYEELAAASRSVIYQHLLEAIIARESSP